MAKEKFETESAPAPETAPRVQVTRESELAALSDARVADLAKVEKDKAAQEKINEKFYKDREAVIAKWDKEAEAAKALLAASV